MDLKNYHAQIIELIAFRNKPDFAYQLDTILSAESNSDKFLIKMELSRLAKPCQRIIDLRDKVNADCELFEHKKISHYLTTNAINIFQENIKLYGLYTIGVYEAVHSHIAQQKTLQSKKIDIEDSPRKKTQCEFLHLGYSNKRAAQRMYFTSNVKILLEDGRRIAAHTSNVSATGVKIKLHADIGIRNSDFLQLIFIDLKFEYAESVLHTEIKYQLVKQEMDEDVHYLYLEYADNKDEFVTFIRHFIRLNQYKYKIDVHYSYQLAKMTALKNAYVAQMNTLPIYLDSRADSPFLFALQNRVNKKLLHEWTCDGCNQLPQLFNELRFAQLLAHARKNATTRLYCFTHSINGQKYFISASEDELLEKGLKDLFIHYGSNKRSWRVYHLTLEPYQYQCNHTYDITQPVPAKFERVTHHATLQPVFLPTYSISQDYDKKELNKINQFVHREKGKKASSIFDLFSGEHRKEDRYLYNSKLSLSTKQADYTGQVIDFSLSGLKIKLDQNTSLVTRSKVTINLLALQHFAKKYPLSNLQYKVVRSSPNNTFHLQVCDSKTLNICSRFFFLLVQNNPKHFKCLPLRASKQPPFQHLIEISEAAFANCVFFIAKNSARPTIRYAAIDNTYHPLLALFSIYSDKRNELNYYPLTNNQLYERLIAQPFKENEIVHKEALIYVKVYRDKNDNLIINSLLESDFTSEKEKSTFITESDNVGAFYALHFRLTTLAPPTFSDNSSDIRLIAHAAAHLLKKLNDELSEINAMIELIDRTPEMIQAFKNKALI